MSRLRRAWRWVWRTVATVPPPAWLALALWSLASGHWRAALMALVLSLAAGEELARQDEERDA